jgi:hypothetical protein
MKGSGFMQQTQVPTDSEMNTELHETDLQVQDRLKDGDKPDLVLTASRSLDPGINAGDTRGGIDESSSKETISYQSLKGKPQLS